MVKYNFKIGIAILIFIVIVKSESHAQIIDTANAYNYVITKKKLIFLSNGNCMPFTMYYRPYGCFFPYDISEGFNSFYNSTNFSIIYLPKDKQGTLIRGGAHYIINDEIDTLMNYFSFGKHNVAESIAENICNEDTSFLNWPTDSLLYLKQELMYSLILNSTNNILINNTTIKEELRLIFPDNVNDFINSFRIVRIAFENDVKAKIYTTIINTEIPQQFVVSKSDSAWLGLKDLKKLRTELRNIEFEKFTAAPPICNEQLIESFEYMIEYKNISSYYHCLLCNYHQDNKELRKIVKRLNVMESLLIFLSLKYCKEL